MKDARDFEPDPLVALQRGDPGPYEDWVKRDAASFLAFFRRLGATRAESEDLVQDVFLKVFRHAQSYEPTGRFRAFAFRIARNAWIDHRRRGAARPPSVAGGDTDEDGAPPPVPDGGPGPVERASRSEEAGRVQAALDQLSDAHRLVFELGVQQELPYAEISDLLSIPVGTVKSRMFHALRKLRELLEGDAS